MTWTRGRLGWRWTLLVAGIAVALLGVAAFSLRDPSVARRISNLLPEAPPPAQVRLTVDAGHRLGPISPLIYGVVGDPEEVRAAGARLNRWGGNPNSRYNWAHGSA